MGRPFFGSALAIWMLFAFATRGASAQVAIESYEQARPPAAGQIIERLRLALGQYGIRAAPGHLKAAMRDIGRPGITDPELTYAQLVERVERGADMLLLASDLPGLQRHLDAVIADIYANPAIVTVERPRELMTRVYVLLAQTRLKQRDRDGAVAALAEQARSCPELPITSSTFGSEIARLFSEMRAAEAKRPPGELTIEVDHPDAQLSINEMPRSQTGRFHGMLAPGTYRVLVRVGVKSRSYEVVVESNTSARLELNWSLETALSVSDDWVGFLLTSDEPDVEELAYASALSRKMSGTTSLVVIDVVETGGGYHVSAARYEGLSGRGLPRSGVLARRGRVVLTSDRDSDRLDALARFVTVAVPVPDVEDTTRTRRGRMPRTTSAPPRADRVATRKRAPLIAIGAGALAVIAGGILYALDEDQDTTGPIEPQYFNSAGAGVAIGASGVLAIGVGAWLWHRGARSTPTLAVGRSSATIGWTGTF